MKEISQTTFCFIDHSGLYQPLAECLAESGKRLLYYDPNAEDSETVNDDVIGDEFPDNPRFERIDDYWLHKKEIDLFVVPDSKHAGEQIELQSQGFPVWGSFRSIFLEKSRETFLRVLEDLGLEVPKYKRIIGIDTLQEYLKPRENQIIKISKNRRTMETKKWHSWDEDEAWLDMQRVKFGGVKNLQPFLVFEAIDKDAFEIGFDTYQIGGKLPGHMLDAYELKDNAYLGAFKPFEELPEQSRIVLEKFRPVLEKAGHANFWTNEIRDILGHFYPIDGTPRGPMPGTGSQIELYRNLPTIIAAGAEGELVEPEPAGKFVCEVALCKKGCDMMWRSTRVPQVLRSQMKLSGVCRVNGRSWLPYRVNDDEGIGWLVAIGDTPQEVVDNILEYKGKLPPGVDCSTESLVDLLREIHKAEEEGIEFTEEEVPAPETVVTDE